MIRADEHMPEPTDEEVAQRLAWQEWQWNYEEDRQRVTMLTRTADIADERDNVTVLLHNCQLVTMDAADVAEFAERIRRVALEGLARIAERRATRAAQQRHLSRYNEYSVIAAEVYAATSDYELPY